MNIKPLIAATPFTQLRFRHYQIHHLLLPYALYTLSVIPIYLFFIVSDFHHIHVDLWLVITVKILLSLGCVLILLLLRNRAPQYLELGEFVLVFSVFASLTYVAQLAMIFGDEHYQSAGLLALVYVGSLSRMAFNKAFMLLTLMLLTHLALISSEKISQDFANAVDNLTLFIAVYFVAVIGCLRRWSESQKSFLKFTKIRNQQLALRKNQQFLSKQNQTDPLTGLKNRLFLSANLERISSSANTLTVLMIDIDNFKQINDTYGHPFGDEVILRVADTIGQYCHGRNKIGVRYGGEEFLCLMVDETAEHTAELAETICHAITQITWPIKQLIVTVSIGVSTNTLHKSGDFKLIEQADEALYQAKSDGKNRVVVYSQQQL
ncbi:GGDEF domain-containing protein [Shewanella algicola]|uniref:GGDEF domain-containing protein n=1 Tax=Shewanella algicola TaxID=640633 RepID=UPI002494865C|nr:GGDEF domain-containing protein [Shewanella algicola]